MKRRSLSRSLRRIKSQIYLLSCLINSAYESGGGIDTADIFELRQLISSAKNLEDLLEYYENDAHGGREIRVIFSDHTGDIDYGEQDY